jgi:hypothetical protein
LNSQRVCAVLAVALLAFFTLRDLARLDGAAPWHRMFDFVDFYCAGDALDRGADPYRYEPMHSCEQAQSHGAGIYASPALAVPAPQPPYDLFAYRFVARMPYATALVTDAIATVLALIACVAALAIAGVPFDIALVALLLPVGFVELGSGQVAVFAITVLVLCGAALARGRDAWAGFFAALIAIEPHVAFPVCVAILAFVPRARSTLLATLAGLTVLAFAAGGGGLVREYLFDVLPAHALAEATNPQQFSATYAAWYLGLQPGAALLLGNVTYALGVVLGVYAASLRRDRSGLERALVAYLPAACAVFGGAFIHIEELPCAVPAALVLACVLSGKRRTIAAAALCVLVVPWSFVWPIKRLFAASLLSCTILLLRLRVTFWPALVVIASTAATIFFFERFPPDLHIALPPGARYAADSLLQVEWTDLMAGLQTRDPLWFAIKLPTWAALAALVVLALKNRHDAERPRPL